MTDSEWARPEMVATTDWLGSHLDDLNLVVVDCDQLPAYLRLHIPGAVASLSHVWKEGGSGAEIHGIDGEEFARLVGRMGIGNDDTVVAYDGSGGLYATRFWWTLDRYGFQDCKLLDGGLDKWYAEGRPLSRENLRPPPKEFRVAPKNDHLYCDLRGVADCLGDPQSLIWDVRSDAEWTGANPRGTQRGGRIPAAVHLEWLEVLEEPLRTLKPPAELRRMLSGLGITPDKVVTTY